MGSLDAPRARKADPVRFANRPQHSSYWLLFQGGTLAEDLEIHEPSPHDGVCGLPVELPKMVG